MEFSVLDVAKGLVPLKPFEQRDLRTLSEDELATALEVAGRLARLADVPGVMLAAEVQRRSKDKPGGGMARRRGHRNATGMVAKQRGGSAGQAHDAIATGGLFGSGDDGDGGGDDAGGGGAGSGGQGGQGGAGAGGEGGGQAPRFPLVAAAVKAGDLSAAQAALLIETLEALDGAGEEVERALVAKALKLSLADLRKACLALRARWDQDRWSEREKRQRGERYLALTENADGMVRISGLLDPTSAAPIKTWVDAQVKAAFRQRREEGLGAAPAGEAGRIRVDALVDLARHGMRCDQPGSGVSTEVVIRIDLDALRTGVGLGSCDAVSSPMSGGQLRRLAVDMKVLPIVLGGGSQVLDVGYARRFFTPAQRHALAERDGGCAFCHAPVAWCDAHHIAWWKVDSGPTDLSNGVLLCTRCHHRIHDDGWQVRATATEVWFIPPASVDPQRRPRQGGKAALHIDLTGTAGPPR
ncbi:HNH endonuclease signature motif containing protein [Demequina rhizosphaerae]|uniref:HNH endonuclease signature motif containing protein n=1 Tax=Demequina rhizosphaerae TaxID=1638985 RepID=UPI0007859BA7|nr:HNH endonuclease signature motif containing protein [Demequina rhizosphaerae]